MRDRYAQVGKEADPTFVAVAQELARRVDGKFDVVISVDLIRERARRRSFLSYGDLASHHGIPWNKARRPIAPHLDQVCDYAHAKMWPLLSAIVVNKESVTTGFLEPDAMKGFIATATRLGFAFSSDQEFLREQQALVFRWAKEGVP